MSRDRRVGALVGFLVASVVAGSLVGIAGASQVAERTAGVADHAPIVAADQSLTVQSAENETLPRENTSVDHDGDRVTLTAAVGERISGETDVAPGTTLSLQVQSEDPQSPFLVSGNATVADDGTFEGTVDLSNAQANLPVTVEVRNDGTTLARADGEVVRCAENCSAPEQWPEFAQAIFRGQHDEAVDVTVIVPDEADGPVNLTIGEADDRFQVETTLIDADGDGRIVLTLDTAITGNGSPSEYLSTGDDELVSARQRSDVLDGGLDAGNYALELGPNDAPYDVGTLVVDEVDQERDDDSTGTDDTDVGVETTGEVAFITAGDTLELGNVENQTIRAETEHDAGTTVHLRITSTDPSNPFLLTPTANVTEYGTLHATIDLSDVAPGSNFEIVAYEGDEAVGATIGRVVECDDGCPRIASGPSQSADDAESNDTTRNESNVVEVNDDDGGSIPVEGLAAIGVGGLLSVLGLVRFTGLLDR